MIYDLLSHDKTTTTYLVDFSHQHCHQRFQRLWFYWVNLFSFLNFGIKWYLLLSYLVLIMARVYHSTWQIHLLKLFKRCDRDPKQWSPKHLSDCLSFILVKAWYLILQITYSIVSIAGPSKPCTSTHLSLEYYLDLRFIFTSLKYII